MALLDLWNKTPDQLKDKKVNQQTPLLVLED